MIDNPTIEHMIDRLNSMLADGRRYASHSFDHYGDQERAWERGVKDAIYTIVTARKEYD